MFRQVWWTSSTLQEQEFSLHQSLFSFKQRMDFYAGDWCSCLSHTSVMNSQGNKEKACICKTNFSLYTECTKMDQARKKSLSDHQLRGYIELFLRCQKTVTQSSDWWQIVLMFWHCCKSLVSYFIAACQRNCSIYQTHQQIVILILADTYTYSTELWVWFEFIAVDIVNIHEYYTLCKDTVTVFWDVC